ncbi:S9 family peptidase [uncultured Kocuria sp.]|uniref:alpha/beta hydrolase family protein n=1 Tax=uncultured Kocuria sp. TaxID=259305 RepID=UPI0025961ED7|nr:alpha/beta hydrolase [uncultured Kocuria sp.]MCT1367637.1 alpha/beta hydrolase [Rothia sp. p3-SID1597]
MLSSRFEKSWTQRLTKPALAVVSLLLLASCSANGSHSGAEAGPSSSASSSPSGANTSSSEAAPTPSPGSEDHEPGPGVDRDAPFVQRIQYPVADGGDPQQNWGDLYLPAGKHQPKTVPLVVLIHGGAWRGGIGAEDFSDYARALVDRGMAVYNIEYRRVGTGGGWPTTFTDVAAAMDHVPEISKKHPEFTTDDETVVGHSAGAQLAMWAGTRDSKNEHELGAHPKFMPTRVVSLAGPLDMTYAADHGDSAIVGALGGSPAQRPDRYSNVDPIQNIDTSIPVVAVHGTADEVVSPVNSQRYIDAVQRAGGKGSLYLMDGDTHGSLIRDEAPHFGRILDIITRVTTKPKNQVGQGASA